MPVASLLARLRVELAGKGPLLRGFPFAGVYDGRFLSLMEIAQ
jgi:hypothetical protein